MTYYRWYHKLSAVLYVVLCFEIGLFLLFFPWSDYWKPNYLANFSPEWGLFWLNPYFRGAISGIGIINIYISVLEAFRLRRFSGPNTPPIHDND
ncbi:MAG: hypothetical protein K7J46_08610 [Bryobacter sp.]|jgi:hypothetical protein|nr:hypothetical protein [Bryobacter sp. CoA8 C33]